MTQQPHILKIIIDRIAFSDDVEGAYFFADEVKTWDVQQFEALLKLGLIELAQQYRDRVTCTGCDEGCVRPVEITPKAEKQAGKAFVVCNQCDDISYVLINFEDLKQWCSSIERFAAVLPNHLETKIIVAADDKQNIDQKSNRQWPLGSINSKKGYVPITLEAHEVHGLILSIGDKQIPLIESLSINETGLEVNKGFIESMVNESNVKESFDDESIRIGRQYDELKRRREKGIRLKLAEQEGKSETAIQDRLTRYKELTKPVNSVFTMGDTLKK